VDSSRRAAEWAGSGSALRRKGGLIDLSAAAERLPGCCPGLSTSSASSAQSGPATCRSANSLALCWCEGDFAPAISPGRGQRIPAGERERTVVGLDRRYKLLPGSRGLFGILELSLSAPVASVLYKSLGFLKFRGSRNRRARWSRMSAKHSRIRPRSVSRREQPFAIAIDFQRRAPDIHVVPVVSGRIGLKTAIKH
jgi:hypothetical protein